MSCRQVLLLYVIVTEARVAEEACSSLCPSGGASEARRPDPVRVRGGALQYASLASARGGRGGMLVLRGRLPRARYR